MDISSPKLIVLHRQIVIERKSLEYSDSFELFILLLIGEHDMFLKGNTIFMFPKGHACFQYILQVQNAVVYCDSI